MKKKPLTASHKMLFTILIIYVLIAALGIFSVYKCIEDKYYEGATTIIIALFSYAAICGSSTIVVYARKAEKENVLEIIFSKYKLKIKLAKQIYKDIAEGHIDKKSVDLFKSLMEEDKEEELVIPETNNTNVSTLKDVIDTIG